MYKRVIHEVYYEENFSITFYTNKVTIDNILALNYPIVMLCL